MTALYLIACAVLELPWQLRARRQYGRVGCFLLELP